jgi:hypothetical protein
MRELASILFRLGLDVASNAASAAWTAANELRCMCLCDRHSHEALRKRNEELRAELETERRVNRIERRVVEREAARKVYS